MNKARMLVLLGTVGMAFAAPRCYEVAMKLAGSGGSTMASSNAAPEAARRGVLRRRFTSPATHVVQTETEGERVNLGTGFDDRSRASEAPAFSHSGATREEAGGGQERIASRIVDEKTRQAIKSGRPGIVTLEAPGAITESDGEKLAADRVRWEMPLEDYFGRAEIALSAALAPSAARAFEASGTQAAQDRGEAREPSTNEGGAETYQEVVARLLDQAGPGPSPPAPHATPPYASLPRVLLPGAEVESERRYVTAAPEEFELAVSRPKETRAPTDAKLPVWYELPPRLRSTEALLLVASVKREEQQWEEIFRGTVSPAPGGLIDAPPSLLAAATDEIAQLEVKVVARALSRSAKWQSSPIEIPPEAILEFGYGIEEAGWREGAPSVTFRVLAVESGGQATRPLFQRRLDPARTPLDRGWKDERVGLNWASGKTVAFVFETKIEGKEPAPTYPLWSNPTVFARRPRPRAAHNIILISIDTLRAQELSCYGYHLSTSPFLEELSRDSATIVFEKAFSTSATTPQAHMSMFTSLEPSLHGITTGLESLSEKLITVSEILRRHGYETGAVTEDGWLSGANGFARGMNIYKENKSPLLMEPTGQVDKTVTDALAWLKRNAQKKVFLFVHTFQVHAPYAPPREYATLFEPFSRDGKEYRDSSRMPAYLIDQLNYDREIRYTDDQLRRFFRGLSELGIARHAVVFITSDHGEEFLEHGYLQHGAHLYDESVRVPLIVWGPEVVKRGPRRVAAPVSILDLMPTILGLVGLPTFAELRGVSLAPTMSAGAQPPLERKLVIEAWGGGALSEDGLVEGWQPPAFAVRAERFKYIMSDLKNPDGPKFELYDLEADPGETKNLLADGRDPFPEGRAILSSYRAEALAKRNLLVGPAESAGHPVQVPLGRDREEKLRALGYIE